jgi:hypothetical protein
LVFVVKSNAKLLNPRKYVIQSQIFDNIYLNIL